jgi:hypothetical protein
MSKVEIERPKSAAARWLGHLGTHCKRGHERVPGELSCVRCRRLREQWKYAENEEFRNRKKSYQRAWHAAFRAQHGHHHSDLFG